MGTFFNKVRGSSILVTVVLIGCDEMSYELEPVDTELSSAAGLASAGSGGDGTFHVFMVMGQSNMVGMAPYDSGDQNFDPRIQVLGGCNKTAGRWNLANPPLHDCPGQSGMNPSNNVSPADWFAQTIAERLPYGHTMGMVPTSEGGQSIDTFLSGGRFHSSILDKIEAAKATPDAVLTGIIFHQGEADCGNASWPDKVAQLYGEIKQAWGIGYDVPFILGEVPNSIYCQGHNPLVHQAAAQLPMGHWITQNNTRLMDLLHFDHASVILMGQRYGKSMIDALGW